MSALKPGTARMTHPDPAVADATVDASQVPHLEHAGWRYVEGDRETWPGDLERSGREGMVYIRHPGTGGTAFVPELTGHLAERGWELAESDDTQAGALEGRTVAELRDLAKERGISPIPRSLAELLDALQEPADQEDAGETGTSEEDNG